MDLNTSTDTYSSTDTSLKKKDFCFLCHSSKYNNTKVVKTTQIIYLSFYYFFHITKGPIIYLSVSVKMVSYFLSINIIFSVLL